MIRPTSHFVFDTSAGFAAIGWSSCGISSFRLPAATRQEVERSLFRRLPDSTLAEPPEPVRIIVDAARRYFGGERIDFSSAQIDLGEQEPFFLRVYDFVRKLD